MQDNEHLLYVHDSYFPNHGNLVIAELEFNVITKNSQGDVVKNVSHTIPIKAEKEQVYNISTVNKQEFHQFYETHKSLNGRNVSPLSHYHSEAFLFFYLLSKHGQEYILHMLTIIKNIKPENTLTILSAKLNFHTTLSMCGSCQKLATDETTTVIGFIDSFSNLLANTLKNHGFNLVKNFNFTITPSYSKEHKSPQEIKHINLSGINPTTKPNPLDYLELEGKFNFNQVSHTAFTSGGSESKGHPGVQKLYTKTSGTIQRYLSSSAHHQLVENAESSSIKIQKFWRSYKAKEKSSKVEILK